MKQVVVETRADLIFSHTVDFERLAIWKSQKAAARSEAHPVTPVTPHGRRAESHCTACVLHSSHHRAPAA
jgi:hypothetical protein